MSIVAGRAATPKNEPTNQSSVEQTKRYSYVELRSGVETATEVPVAWLRLGNHHVRTDQSYPDIISTRVEIRTASSSSHPPH